MYMQYRAINPSTKTEVLEIAEMVGITLNPDSHFVILTLAENYMDVYFKLKQEEYEKMVEEICNTLDEGKEVYRIKHIGVLHDVAYFKKLDDAYAHMNQLFETMIFKES